MGSETPEIAGPRVIGYVRVSTEEQARDGVSLSSQEERIRGYCGLYGLTLVAVVRDEGVSAKNLDRPALRGALAALREGSAAGIVVAKLDRLTRSVRDLGELLEGYFGERAGKLLFSVGDQIDTTKAAGRLVLNVLMSVAQWERETIVERTRDAMQHKRSKGERVGTVPYGYTVGPDGKTLEACAAERHAIEFIRGLRAKGDSVRQIVAALNESGIASRSGRPWGTSSVAAIINREAGAKGGAA